MTTETLTAAHFAAAEQCVAAAIDASVSAKGAIVRIDGATEAMCQQLALECESVDEGAESHVYRGVDVDGAAWAVDVMADDE